MSGRVTLNNNSVEPLGGPNLGLSTEQGDSWNSVIASLNAMLTELYGAAKQLIAGASTALFGASGNISTNITTIGSSATNTTQTLLAYVLPAKVLNAVGNGIIVTAWGHKAGNAAPVTLALNVGGTTINSGSETQSGPTWVMTAEVYKTAANAQQELLQGQVGTVFIAPKATTDTSVDTGTINISVTALDASAAQSNVFLDGLVVEFMP